MTIRILETLKNKKGEKTHYLIESVCGTDSSDGGIVQVIKAPMNGTIASIKCRVGDFVRSGQVLLILEAMKMENEIYSGSSGIVKEIRVKEGDFVRLGAILVVVDTQRD